MSQLIAADAEWNGGEVIDLYAYCFGGDVFSSADAGKTWTLVSSALRAP